MEGSFRAALPWNHPIEQGLIRAPCNPDSAREANRPPVGCRQRLPLDRSKVLRRFYAQAHEDRELANSRLKKRQKSPKPTTGRQFTSCF
jgi:hypothetical protein